MGGEIAYGDSWTVEESCGERTGEVDEELGGLFAVEDELVDRIEDYVAEKGRGDVFQIRDSLLLAVRCRKRGSKRVFRC